MKIMKGKRREKMSGDMNRRTWKEEDKVKKKEEVHCRCNVHKQHY